MPSILIALAIGIIAGIIDAAPMIIMKLPKSATLSAFTHYLILGLIIPFINWDLSPWLIGLIVSVLSVLPVMIIVGEKDKKSIPPMIVFSVILGIGIGVAGDLLI